MIAVGDSVWLGGIAGVVVVVVVALILGRNMNATLGKLVVKVDAVNHAVNNKPEGAPTISEQVGAIHELVVSASGRISDNAAITVEHGRRLDVLEGKVATIEHLVGVPAPPITGEVPKVVD